MDLFIVLADEKSVISHMNMSAGRAVHMLEKFQYSV